MPRMLLAAALPLAGAPAASDHMLAGDRIFPVTPTFDDRFPNSLGNPISERFN